MVKLVDTLASGASALTGVEVQVLSWAPFSSKLYYIIIVCNKFVTVFRVLNPLKMGVCEEHAYSHSVIAPSKTPVFTGFLEYFVRPL